MFQPDLQLHSLNYHHSSFSSNFSRREDRNATMDRSESTLAHLKETLCAETSPNKRAVIEQLLKLWSQGNLD